MFITKNFNNIVNNIIEKNHHLSRKVIQINPHTLYFIIWNSVNEASKVLKIDQGNISGVCNGKLKFYKGYYWRYYDEFINSQYIRCDNNNRCDIFNLLPGGNLGNYIQPCFTLLPGEILKDISNYEGLYQASNYGRIISIKNYPYINELKPVLDKDGYCIVSLYDNNIIRKIHKIHRLVAQVFIPNPNNLPCINHIDEIKINNRINNIEWCTHEYNCNYGNRLERIAKSKKNIINL